MLKFKVGLRSGFATRRGRRIGWKVHLQRGWSFRISCRNIPRDVCSRFTIPNAVRKAGRQGLISGEPRLLVHPLLDLLRVLAGLLLVVPDDGPVNLVQHLDRGRMIGLVANRPSPGVMDHEERALRNLHFGGRQRDPTGARRGDTVDMGDHLRGMSPESRAHRAGFEDVATWRVDSQMDDRGCDRVQLVDELFCSNAPVRADRVIEVDRRFLRVLLLDSEVGFVFREFEEF